jgi:DNA-binding transcriptional ArsR family regulator
LVAQEIYRGCDIERGGRMKAGKSMQELSEWNELKTFFDRRLIKALGHPVREHILAVLNERVASAREIGEEIGADVSSFYHHIELLEELDCIERVASRPRRGAKEHFFQAKKTVLLDDSEWQQLPASVRTDLAASFIQEMFDDAAAALQGGTLSPNADEHVSWTPAHFDRQGWKETTCLLTETLDRLIAIQKQSAVRLADSKADPITASVSILAFETPGEQATGANGKVRGPEQTPRPSSAP